MRPQRAYLDYIQDIHDAIERVAEFIAGMDYEEFEKDAKTSFAVVRALEVVGEAAKAIPESVRTRHAAVPWQSLAGMRDKLIHHYFGVDLRVVWKTATEDLPELAPPMMEILREAESEDGGHGKGGEGTAT